MAPNNVPGRHAGARLFISGSTGTLGKVYVERLLHETDVARLYLLIRGGSQQDVEDRARLEVFGSSAFAQLREKYGPRFTDRIASRIHIVRGDLSLPNLGIDPSTYAAIASDITHVVSCAATTTFDERLDVALALNTRGPLGLLMLARDAGHVPLLHVSTCYVASQASRIVHERLNPPPRVRERADIDDDEALDELLRSLDVAVAEATAGPQAQMDARLSVRGRKEAQRHGWCDVYTMTKYLGEQLLVRYRDRVPLAILRPSIIESSVMNPSPGWLEQLRVADPLIAAYGRRSVRTLPAKRTNPLDLVPLDFAANAMLASLPARTDDVSIHQLATSHRNPLTFERFGQLLREGFNRHLAPGYGRLRFLHAHAYLPMQRTVGIALDKTVALAPRWTPGRARMNKLAATHSQRSRLMDLYWPYMMRDSRFVDDSTVRLWKALDDDSRRRFPFDTAAIDWHTYIVNTHIPAVLRAMRRRRRREVPALRFGAIQQSQV